MFCPNCGTKVKDGAAFCPECGTKIIAPVQPSKPQNQAQNQTGNATITQGASSVPALPTTNFDTNLIAPIAAGIGVVAYLLFSVISMSAGAFGVNLNFSFNGFEMAFGKTVSIMGYSEHVDGNFVFILFILPLVGALAASLTIKDKKTRTTAQLGLGVLSLIAIIVLGIMARNYADETMGASVDLSMGFGYWLPIIASLVVAIPAGLEFSKAKKQ